MIFKEQGDGIALHETQMREQLCGAIGVGDQFPVADHLTGISQDQRRSLRVACCVMARVQKRRTDQAQEVTHTALSN